jgi:hypothetical protein
MSNTNTGGPAFPAPAGVAHITDQGMTLRDYFAAKAMLGMLTDPSWQRCTCKTVAEEAYKMADAMLKAREA